MARGVKPTRGAEPAKAEEEEYVGPTTRPGPAPKEAGGVAIRGPEPANLEEYIEGPAGLAVRPKKLGELGEPMVRAGALGVDTDREKLGADIRGPAPENP